MHKSLIVFAAMLVLPSFAGCYRTPHMDYSAVNLVPAHGAVTLDQQPLAQATVVFEAPDKQFSFATTDATGKYALQFDSAQRGVTPGPKIVRIRTTGPIGEAAESTAEEGAAPPATAVERVPARYNRQSELKVDVSPDRNEYNFELTLK
jgi:hypothetical protein